MAELLRGRLGDAIREAIGAAGAESRDELEAIFYEPDAPILGLTPPVGPVPALEVDRTAGTPGTAWTITLVSHLRSETDATRPDGAGRAVPPSRAPAPSAARAGSPAGRFPACQAAAPGRPFPVGRLLP